jgi:hypothetical protein
MQTQRDAKLDSLMGCDLGNICARADDDAFRSVCSAYLRPYSLFAQISLIAHEKIQDLYSWRKKDSTGGTMKKL